MAKGRFESRNRSGGFKKVRKLEGIETEQRFEYWSTRFQKESRAGS